MMDDFHIEPEGAEKYRDERGARHVRRTSVLGVMLYRGFHIVEKLDFGATGFHIQGFGVRHGYIVTDGLCAVMPGGAWHLTVGDAMKAIDDLIASQEMERHADNNRTHPFWTLSRLRLAAEERAPELAKVLAQLYAAYYTRDGEGRQDKLQAALGEAQGLLAQLDDSIDTRSIVRHVDGRRERVGERTSPTLNALAGAD